MSEIRFVIEYQGKEHTIVTHQHEYRSLMALLYDKFYFENFGDCKGIGRCGTCHVKVDHSEVKLLQRVGNEHTTLGKMENVSNNSRLSCHILITEDINNARFIIADDGNIGLY
jgi:2Fe-2S ferredoxin